MSKKLRITLDDIPTPKSLEQQPSKIEIPKELNYVKEEHVPKVTLNLSDRWNIAWGGIKHAYDNLMTVARSLTTLKWIIVGSIILVVIIILGVKIL